MLGVPVPISINVGLHGHPQGVPPDAVQDALPDGPQDVAQGVRRLCAEDGRFAAAGNDGLGGRPDDDDARAVAGGAADTRCQ